VGGWRCPGRRGRRVLFLHAVHVLTEKKNMGFKEGPKPILLLW